MVIITVSLRKIVKTSKNNRPKKNTEKITQEVKCIEIESLKDQYEYCDGNNDTFTIQVIDAIQGEKNNMLYSNMSSDEDIERNFGIKPATTSLNSFQW